MWLGISLGSSLACVATSNYQNNESSEMGIWDAEVEVIASGATGDRASPVCVHYGHDQVRREFFFLTRSLLNFFIL